LTFEELMQFRQIRGAQISADGGWIAYALVPDRGDGEAVVRSSVSSIEYRIERGSSPRISADGRWVAAAISPSLEEREKAQDKKGQGKGDDDKPQKGLSVVDLRTGSELRIEKVEAFAFSDDGRWLAYRHYKEKEKKEEEPEKQPEAEEASEEEKEKNEGKEKKKKEDLGSTLKLRNLATEEEISVEYVSEFVFAEQAPIIAYTVSAPEGTDNGLFIRALSQHGVPATALHEVARGRYTHLAWAKEDPLTMASPGTVRSGPGAAAVMRASWFPTPRHPTAASCRRRTSSPGAATASGYSSASNQAKRTLR
jgi:hypothetical protein